MITEPNLRRARNCFAAVVILGLGVAVIGNVWLAAYGAATADVVLSREELRDPKLVDIVYRTHRTFHSGMLVPFYIAGALLVLSGWVGLHALRDISNS